MLRSNLLQSSNSHNAMTWHLVWRAIRGVPETCGDVLQNGALVAEGVPAREARGRGDQSWRLVTSSR